jgi:sec-independent protein translocase protein TatA
MEVMTILGAISNLLGGDMWILLVIVLILFGAKKLPELARGMGQAIREFNKAKDEFDRELTQASDTTPKVQAPKEQQEHKPTAI